MKDLLHEAVSTQERRDSTQTYLELSIPNSHLILIAFAMTDRSMTFIAKLVVSFKGRTKAGFRREILASYFWNCGMDIQGQDSLTDPPRSL